MITSKELINYFDECVRKREKGSLGEITGNPPYSPTLVLYLGKDSLQAHVTLYAKLRDMWPQFEGEIQFAAIDENGSYRRVEEPDFYDSDEDVSGIEYGEKLTVNDVLGMITTMFSGEMHFECRHYLSVYYVMDTSSYESRAAYDTWIERLNTFRGEVNLELQDTLVILLCDDLIRTHIEVAKEIRRNLSAYTEGGTGEKETVPLCTSVGILSRRTYEAAIVASWDVCYNLIGYIIAISNDNSKYASLFGSNRVFSIGHAMIEKPVKKIGQVVVHSLLDEFDSYYEEAEELKIDRDTLQKLGITQKGTIGFLDDYINAIELPDPELFPRTTDEDVDVYSLSPDEFNVLTMNSWKYYINSIIDNAANSFSREIGFQKKVRTAIEQRLHANFTKTEIAELENHMAEILGNIKPQPGAGGDIREQAYQDLSVRLSSHPDVIAFFKDCILSASGKAKEFVDLWATLRATKRRTFQIGEPTLDDFYKNIVQHYLDRNISKLRDGFRSLETEEELREFLCGAIDSVIESNKIFTRPFDEELEVRLKKAGMTFNKKDYITSGLTGANISRYISNISFGLNEPELSVVLMDTRTSLKDEIDDVLRDIELTDSATGNVYYYYNTGINSSAETMHVYLLNKENLIS